MWTDVIEANDLIIWWDQAEKSHSETAVYNLHKAFYSHTVRIILGKPIVWIIQDKQPQMHRVNK